MRTNITRLSLPLLLLSIAANAEVYKWVGPDGTIHFSDEARKGAEKVDLPPIQIVPKLKPAPAKKSGNEHKKKETSGKYSRFAIVSPTKDQAIRSNNGVVSVTMRLEPALQPGDKFQVAVDGVDRTVESLTFNLSNLPRGGHTINATVVDEAGKPLIQAEAVTFYVLRVVRKRAP